MRIQYNPGLHRFEAVFTTDFHGDHAAVKAAGFRTDGAPGWIWWTDKLKVLNKLRENKPISGLEITNAAYEVYTRLASIEAQNEAIREQFKPHAEEVKKKRAAKRKLDQKERVTVKLDIPDKGYLGAEDFDPMPPFEFKIPILKHQGPWCSVCQAPVYPYEKQEPAPICIWCEKMLDKQPVQC